MKPDTTNNIIKLWTESQKCIKQLENKLKGKVLTYFVGVDFSMTDYDVQYFYSHLKQIGRHEKLFFILYSCGGDAESAWRIAYLLKSFCNKLNIVIPERAASAATILSLAADNLIMTPLSYLTAVDTSFWHALNPQDEDKKAVYVSLDEVNRAIKTYVQNQKKKADHSEAYKTLFQYIHPVAFGAIQRHSSLSEMLCNDVLDLRHKKLSSNSKKILIKKLNSGYPSHGYPITRVKAQELGLPVQYSDEKLNDLLWQLLNNYYSIAKAKITNKVSSIHQLEIAKIIESDGIRFERHKKFIKKVNKITKAWETIHDEAIWHDIHMEKVNNKNRLVQSEIGF